MALEARDISKTYTDMAKPVEVLKELNFKVSEGEAIGIYGASGTGKSTLLHIIGGLDNPTSGEVISDNVSLTKLSSNKLARFRNRHIGFVFQFYHLLAEFTALENAMIPALIAGESKRNARNLAREALVAMGLENRLDHRPAMLSGGERQRVALARAAVMKPPFILADEPTGNLDMETGKRIWKFLLDLNRAGGSALVVVTHNRDLLNEFESVYELKGGKLNGRPH